MPKSAEGNEKSAKANEDSEDSEDDEDNDDLEDGARRIASLKKAAKLLAACCRPQILNAFWRCPHRPQGRHCPHRPHWLWHPRQLAADLKSSMPFGAVLIVLKVVTVLIVLIDFSAPGSVAANLKSSMPFGAVLIVLKVITVLIVLIGFSACLSKKAQSSCPLKINYYL